MKILLMFINTTPHSSFILFKIFIKSLKRIIKIGTFKFKTVASNKNYRNNDYATVRGDPNYVYHYSTTVVRIIGVVTTIKSRFFVKYPFNNYETFTLYYIKFNTCLLSVNLFSLLWT